MSTERGSAGSQNTGRVPGCLQCDQVFDGERQIVHDTEHFVSYVSPVYPWGVILTTRRHECDGPWALTEDEAGDLGTIIPPLAAAIRSTGSERVYLAAFGEETPIPHFHLAVLSRYLPMSETERSVLSGRVQQTTSDPMEDATDFAAAVRAHLGSTEGVGDTEHFVGSVSPRYPWAVMFDARRHECDGPWSLTEDEAVDLGRLIQRVSEAVRRTGSERVYILSLGESAVPHFRIGFLSRYRPLADAEHDVMYERVRAATSNPSLTSMEPHSPRPSMQDRAANGSELAQTASDFARAVRVNLDETARRHD